MNINNKTNRPDHMIRDQYEKEMNCKAIESQLPDYLADYFIFLRSSVALATREAYLNDILFFFDYLKTELLLSTDTIKSVKNLKARDINLFLDYCRRYYKAKDDESIQIFENHNRSLSRKKSSLSSMFKFLFRNEQLPEDITPGLNPIKMPKTSPESIKRLETREMMELIEVVNTGKGLTDKEKIYWEKTKYRDRAIILLFLTYGLRLKELVNLNLSSFHFKRKEFTIFRKRGKESQMPLNETTENAIKEYMELERKLLVKDDEALFLSLQGTRMTAKAVRLMVKKYTAIVMDTTVRNAYSPHKLRATAASTLIERGFSIYDVQNLLDHDNVTTTQLYSAHRKNVKKDIVQNFELDEEIDSQ